MLAAKALRWLREVLAGQGRSVASAWRRARKSAVEREDDAVAVRAAA